MTSNVTTERMELARNFLKTAKTMSREDGSNEPNQAGNKGNAAIALIDIICTHSSSSSFISPLSNDSIISGSSLSHLQILGDPSADKEKSENPPIDDGDKASRDAKQFTFHILASSKCKEGILNTEPMEEIQEDDLDPPTCKEDLNWCAYEELDEYSDLFDASQRVMIQKGIHKQDVYSKGFDKGNYFDNLFPIISSGFNGAMSILHCGTKIGGVDRPCRQWHLCSRCAYFKALNSIGYYYSKFNDATFDHLTCSFDGSLPFSHSGYTRIQDHWKANELAIRKAINHKVINGAYIAHELKILSFLPTLVLPHSHVLISGSEPLTEDRRMQISEWIAQSTELVPSLKVSRIESKSGLANVLKYQTKAIDLKAPYEKAFNEFGQKRIRELNLEMRNFLDTFEACKDHFPKIIRAGNLRSNTKNSIVIKGKKAQKESLKQYRLSWKGVAKQTKKAA